MEINHGVDSMTADVGVLGRLVQVKCDSSRKFYFRSVKAVVVLGITFGGKSIGRLMVVLFIYSFFEI